ncbi:sigma-70 family RNA polymerase sigma factor [Halalkalibacillus halophilus]|uniref:sigma-70 family RNA polymerase sigma factor n=1 Tax=Halalkalibacillus halophilus TaxID=392827 RepID=UPI000427C1FA|nr:sigma-70 family RNA polymerase sigma factor [Halalkalibacillus halophilus]
MKVKSNEYKKYDDFQELLSDYNKMIHYQIHRLGVRDYYGEFYQEGVTALWEAHEKYGDHETFPKLATMYIRNRMIDLIRKKKKYEESEVMESLISDTPVHNSQIESFDPLFWKTVHRHLSAKQWIFVRKRIIEGYSIKEIAEMENTTADAVKGWGKEVKRKLKPIMSDFI